MERKCSLKKHNEYDAVLYCQECNIYMCNKCANYHTELFENHNKYELGKENIITSLCKEKNHKSELKFYCKNHNKLCCCICISKIKGEEYGQHTDCDVCVIENIIDEKKNKLKENIKYLENSSLSIEKSMEELKKIIIKIDEDKDNLKLKVSKIFTKLRNAINNREDEILEDIDNKFNEFIFDEKILKKSEKLPNQIKEFLEKGKNIEKEWTNEHKKINLLINECIDIENSINTIKIISEGIEKYNSQNVNFKFYPEEEDEINKIINTIKSFGCCKLKEDGEYIHNLDSLIIKDNKKYNALIKSWINQKKIIKAKLLYRLTRDGDKISKFHQLCDNKGPTLTLFLVNDGNIGGIYTPLSWDTTSNTKKDKDTFMFNLNKNEKYKKNHEPISIWCTENFGPWTVNFGFTKTMKQIEHRGKDINQAYENSVKILPNDSNKTKIFDINEAEVYELLIENNN